MERATKFFAVGAVFFSTASLAETPPYYSLQVLGNIPGGTFASVAGINNAGEAVGTVSGPSSVCPVGCAVVWHSGTPTLLGSVVGAVATSGISINNAGQVAGIVYTGKSPSYNEQAVIWTNGTPTLLPNPLAQSTVSFATHINDAGAIVGSALGSDNAASAIIWNGITPTVLEFLPGYTYAEASGINDNGLVVGNICCDSYGTYTAVVWHGTTPKLLPLYHQMSSSEAVAVDNAGLVVGKVNDYASAWANGVATEIGSFNSSATSINNRGNIVGGGEISPDGQQALLWGRIDAQPQELHDLITTRTTISF